MSIIYKSNKNFQVEHLWIHRHDVHKNPIWRISQVAINRNTSFNAPGASSSTLILILTPFSHAFSLLLPLEWSRFHPFFRRSVNAAILSFSLSLSLSLSSVSRFEFHRRRESNRVEPRRGSVHGPPAVVVTLIHIPVVHSLTQMLSNRLIASRAREITTTIGLANRQRRIERENTIISGQGNI